MKTISLLRLFLCGLCLFLVGACGPVIQLLDVDVKLPAIVPINLNNKELAFFNTIHSAAIVQDSTLISQNDSLLMSCFVQGMAEQVEQDLSMSQGTIPVYNHFCEGAPCGTLEDTAYVYSLAAQSQSQILILVDSLSIGAFSTDMNHSQAIVEYVRTYVYVPYEAIVRIFDTEEERFVRYVHVRDTIYWEVLSKTLRSNVLPPQAYSSIKLALRHAGRSIAGMWQSQWETQERALFTYNSSQWSRALAYAEQFEWQKAQKIWIQLSGLKKQKAAAYAAYNVAVACEMLGNFDLALQWLEQSRKRWRIPEIDYYAKMIGQRKQQKQQLQLQMETE